LFKAVTLQAGPGTLSHHPLFVIGSLYLSTSGINEYWVLVQVLGLVLE